MPQQGQIKPGKSTPCCKKTSGLSRLRHARLGPELELGNTQEPLGTITDQQRKCTVAYCSTAQGLVWTGIQQLCGLHALGPVWYAILKSVDTGLFANAVKISVKVSARVFL